jgi:hypothetical protein
MHRKICPASTQTRSLGPDAMRRDRASDLAGLGSEPGSGDPGGFGAEGYAV